MYLTILLLALGATAGAAVRFYTTLWAAEQFGLGFPYGTLVVNLVGSFVLGAFLTLVDIWPAISPDIRLVVSTGFCGSLTTFSTFGYETIDLIQRGQLGLGILNALGSVVLGLLAVLLGIWLVRLVTGT